MVQSCCVHGCTNKSSQKLGKTFHVVPKVHVMRGDNFEYKLSKKRRQKWIEKLCWKNWKPDRYSNVCSDHFISGKPSKLWDTKNIDWIPTLKLQKSKTKSFTEAQIARNQRMQQKITDCPALNENHNSPENDTCTTEIQEAYPNENACEMSEKEMIVEDLRATTCQSSQTETSEICCSETQTDFAIVEEEILIDKHHAENNLLKRTLLQFEGHLNEMQTKMIELETKYEENKKGLLLNCEREKSTLIITFTETQRVTLGKHEKDKQFFMKKITTLEAQNASLSQELWTSKKMTADLKLQNSKLHGDFQQCQVHLTENSKKLQDLQATAELSEVQFREDEDKLKYYTGLHSWTVFTALFTLVSTYLLDTPKLSKFQRLLLVLMKLRLNLGDADLAYRFHVSHSTVSRNFHRVLGILYIRTKPLIAWPDRDVLRSTMPLCFRKFFKKCVAIVDCSEVRIERPTDLLARGQVWSNYKHHSTMKFLLGVTPQGTISFVSSMWGGRSSDKTIIENCGLLDMLTPGDLILADRGFSVQGDSRLVLAEIKIPPFTKGKKQLSQKEVDWTRELAHVRIHVERVIGSLKQKFTLLESVLPINLLASNQTSVDVATTIVNVCAALVNLCPPIIPLD